jgi:hypothetical protein
MGRFHYISLSLIVGILILGASGTLSSSATSVAKTIPAKSKIPWVDNKNWAPKKPTCNCRANGIRFELGEITCIKTINGLVRARCQLEQNNTNWQVLSKNCEIVSNTNGRSLVAKPQRNQCLAS